MKKLSISLAILGGIFLSLNNAQAANTDIIITEIGAYEGSGYEWVEIYNKGNEPVNLDGWKFWEYGTNHGLSLKQGNDMVLAPAEYAIITQNDVNFLSKYLNLNVKIIDSSWSSLNESGEEIGLKDAEGNFVEQFTYASASNFSLQRKDYDLADYSVNNWVEHADGNTVGANNDFTQAVGNNEQNQAESTHPPVDEATGSGGQANNEGEVLGYEVRSVVINEFLSDAFDEQVEFVELYNNSQYTIDLTGWWIEEGSGKKSILGGSILVNNFFILEKPKGSLNNTGDIIKLFDPAGGLIDSVAYGAWDDGNTNNNAPNASDPFVIARVYDGVDTNIDNVDFAITKEITKGQPNIIYMDTVESGVVLIKKSAIISTATTTEATVVKKAEPNGEVPMEIGNVKIIITEILPNPAGSDSTEMIELYNPSDVDFNLTGLKLDDEEGGSTPFKFPENTIIKAGEYMVFGKWDTKIALNNTIDSARLLWTDGTVIDEIDYSSVIEGASFGRDEDGEWQWTTNITPGSKNIFSKPAAKITANTVSNKPNVATSLSEIHLLEVGSKVKTKGIVSVLPNVFGTQYFYITDNLAGVQIYMYKKDFPELRIGNEVEVVGEISVAYGETRVKIKGKSDIVILGEGELIVNQIEISKITEDFVGSFLQISGEVTEKKSTYIYLDDGSEEIKVYFKKNADIDKSNFEAGDNLVVSGILGASASGLQLLPRFDADIELSSAVSSTSNVIITTENKNLAVRALKAAAGGFATLLIGIFINARRFFVARFVKNIGAVVLAFVKRR